MKAEVEANKVSLQSLVREELNFVIADAQYDLSKAALAEAKAGIVNSIGLDGTELSIDTHMSVAALAAVLRSAHQGWDRRTRIVRND